MPVSGAPAAFELQLGGESPWFTRGAPVVGAGDVAGAAQGSCFNKLEVWLFSLSSCCPHGGGGGEREKTPMGSISPEYASCFWWWLVVRLWAAVLQRTEPKVADSGIAPSPSIKLGCRPDLRISVVQLSMCGHHGGGVVDAVRIWSSSRFVRWGVCAAGVPRSSSVGDLRQPALSCPCFFWPKGGPPQPQFVGCSSTSRREADAEAIHPLHPGVQRCPRPKWCVPGGGDAGQKVEQSSSRWRRTRLHSVSFVLGPFCKITGSSCNLFLYANLIVICNPPLE